MKRYVKALFRVYKINDRYIHLYDLNHQSSVIIESIDNHDCADKITNKITNLKSGDVIEASIKRKYKCLTWFLPP